MRWPNTSRICALVVVAAVLLGPSTATKRRLTARRGLEDSETSGVGEAAAARSGRPEMVDVWEADPELRLFKRLRERDPGDHQPVLDILGLGVENEELEEFWADPKVAHHILTNFPMFRAFGIGNLADKAKQDFTSEDGLAALAAFRAFARRAVERLGDVTDPSRLAGVMQGYAEMMDSDDTLREMVARVEAGDREAALALHDKIADDIWGGTVDLYQMGLDGREPRALAKLRTLVQETEPALWRLITQDDPLITQMMADPNWVLQFADGLDNKSSF